MQGHVPSEIRAGTDPATGDTRILVNDPGASSEAGISSGGTTTLRVEASEGIGTEGEARALEAFQTRLMQEAIDVSITTGVDADGEDAVLNRSDDSLVLQIVTVPAVDYYWRDASQGSANTEVALDGAVRWLHEAIEKKAQRMPVAERNRTVLLLDARHAGVVSTQTVVSGYLGRHGDPSAVEGFAGVWVVGPTAEFCARLGQGIP